MNQIDQFKADRLKKRVERLEKAIEKLKSLRSEYSEPENRAKFDKVIKKLKVKSDKDFGDLQLIYRKYNLNHWGGERERTNSWDSLAETFGGLS